MMNMTDMVEIPRIAVIDQVKHLLNQIVVEVEHENFVNPIK